MEFKDFLRTSPKIQVLFQTVRTFNFLSEEDFSHQSFSLIYFIGLASDKSYLVWWEIHKNCKVWKMAALTDWVRLIIERQPTTTWRPRPASMGTGDETNIVRVILQVPSRYLQKKPTVIFFKVNFASATTYSSSCISLVFWWDLAIHISFFIVFR